MMVHSTNVGNVFDSAGGSDHGLLVCVPTVLVDLALLSLANKRARATPFH